MPQYLAPGVYVEEISFRTGTIEGVSTSTAALRRPHANRADLRNSLAADLPV